MEEKLKYLYNECRTELNSIGINLDEKNIGKINISLTNRNTKRYGCCRQENPDKTTKYYEKIGYKKFVRYYKFNTHNIEISKWVMDLNESIIKNTIMHEIIHCFPGCNNHGDDFKKYANYINEKLGYEISRVGNKREDYEKSNLNYIENQSYKYKIKCEQCGQIFYRNRCAKNLSKKYRCGKCKRKIIYNRSEIKVAK